VLSRRNSSSASSAASDCGSDSAAAADGEHEDASDRSEEGHVDVEVILEGDGDDDLVVGGLDADAKPAAAQAEHRSSWRMHRTSSFTRRGSTGSGSLVMSGETCSPLRHVMHLNIAPWALLQAAQ
jgi:hypothetical protein